MDELVFQALLAMDSYHRGYDAGVVVPGKKLGLATFRSDSQAFGGQDIGFYASVYDWDGKTVISFRGTTFASSVGQIPAFASDIIEGWSMFLGFGPNRQPGYAKAFYEHVTGLTFVDHLDEYGPGNVLLTGHSLGGALAGFVGARSYADTVVFDPTPYGAVTWQSVMSEAFIATALEFALDPQLLFQLLGPSVLLGTVITGTNLLWQDFADRFRDNIIAREPGLELISGAALQGEIASAIPSLQGPLATAIIPLLPFLGFSALAQDMLTDLTEDRSLIATVANYGVQLDPASLHSMALLTTILYGDRQWTSEGGTADWHSAAKYFLASLNDAEIAGAVGTTWQGAYAIGDQMAQKIAYSSINVGDRDARPFGDVAIRALFNDGDDFGRVLTSYSGSLPSLFNDGVKQQIGRLIVEFSGLLAYNAVYADAGNGALRAGTLAFGDGPDSPNSAFNIDLRESTWTMPGTSAAHEITVKQALVNAFLTADPSVSTSLGEISGWYGEHSGISTPLVDEIDFIIMSLRPGTLFVSGVSEKIELVVGTSGADAATLSDGTDFVLGGDGADVLHGGGGIDILLGGKGGDTLRGGDADDWLDGADDDDYLYGDDGNDELRGGRGNDHLTGGEGQDILRGGMGEDTLVGSTDWQVDDGVRDIYYGGAGLDRFMVGGEDIIARDGDERALGIVDQVYFNGKLLTGGERPDAAARSNGAYFNKNGTSYLFEGSLTVSPGGQTLGFGRAMAGGVVTIEEFRNGDGGIRLRNKRPDMDEAEKRRDPLIFDLDGDRMVLTSLDDSSAYFDLDGDGFREHVAWTRGGDGLLVYDRNGNGSIDDGSELFGSGYRETDAGGVQSRGTEGFDDLARLDSNDDGVIDAADAEYGALQIWIDADGDALTGAGELHTLASLGIVSISVTPVRPNNLDEPLDSSLVTWMSTATTADGAVLRVYDAFLAVDSYDTVEIVDTVIPDDFATLPFLIGSGTLSDLDVAMARDPALEEMVRAFAALTPAEASEIEERVQAILLRWTGADDIAADTRGANMNARWLAALETISGSGFYQASIGTNPRADAAKILIPDWSELVANTTAELLGQTALGQQLLPGLSFAGAAFFTVEQGTTLATLLAAAAAHTPDGASDQLGYWRTIVVTLGHYRDQLGETEESLRAALDTALATAGVPLGSDQIAGAFLIGEASGIGMGLADAMIAGPGAVELRGGSGNNHYLVTAEAETVTIDDAGGNDIVDLLGWSRAETEIVTTLTSEPRIDGTNYYASIGVELRRDGQVVAFEASFTNGRFTFGVDEIRFADGVARTADLITGIASIVIGAADPDSVVAGATGTDFLIGRGPSDQYRLAAGGGHDVIIDAANVYSADGLTIDALPADVAFTIADAYGRSLLVTLASGESVLIADQWVGDGAGIELFRFADGSARSAADLRLGFTTGTPDAEVIRGTAGVDLLDGHGGADLLRGGGGGDVYRYEIGYGDLTIDDAIGQNILQLGSGITAADLHFTADPDGLVITVGDLGTIRLNGDRYGSAMTIVADGAPVSVTDWLTAEARLAGTSVAGTIYGTMGDDTITGTSAAERIDAKGGRDSINGGGGNDIYLFGEGRKQIGDMAFGYDTLQIAAGYTLEDLILTTTSYGAMRVRLDGTDARADLNNRFTINGAVSGTGEYDIERILFTDGRTIDIGSGKKLIGTAGDDFLFSYGQGQDVFTPGAGDDRMFAVNGAHRVSLTEGYGHDVFFASYNAVVLFNGINFDDQVDLARSGNDLVVTTAGGADSIVIKDAFEPGSSNKISYLAFANAILYGSDVAALLAVATPGDDLLFGRQELDGGAGNDVLIGSSQANHYVFGRGYGHDVVKEQDSSSGNMPDDVLTLTGLTRDDVTFARSADDPLSIVITIRDTGETLTLDGTPFDDWAYNFEDSLGDGYPIGDHTGAHWIDRIEFADGTAMSQLEIEQEILASERTNGADILTNFGVATNQYPSRGAVLDGGAGNDRYINAFDEVMVRFAPNSGQDVLEQESTGRGRVWIELDGLDVTDVLVRFEMREGRAYTVLHTHDGSELAIQGWISGDTFDIVVRDENGQEYYPTLEGGLVTDLTGTRQSDYLTGFLERTGGEVGFLVPHSETFHAGRGDDVIAGHGGIDTIVFERGGGADVLLSMGGLGAIIEGPDGEEFTQAGYVVSFGAGIARDEIAYEWLNDGSFAVRILVGDTGDSITVDAREIRSLLFGNGERIDFGTVDDGRIVIEPGNFAGNGSDDQIFYAPDGNAGLAFNGGSGHDRFIDGVVVDHQTGDPLPSNWHSSTLSLDTEIGLDEFEFVRDTDVPGNLVIRSLLTGATLVVEGQFGEAPASAWTSADRDGDGSADWAEIDTNGDGSADAMGLDSDGDGAPNWLAPDFNGDGQSDWRRVLDFRLDADGDGEEDASAFDDDGDGQLDYFTLRGDFGEWGEIVFRDLDGDGSPDEYSTDWDNWLAVPTLPDGSKDWAAIDTDGDGIGDAAMLDGNGDGTPEWTGTDLNGDGASDWVDRSYDYVENADGAAVAIRRILPDAETVYGLWTGWTMMVARDTDGDLVPDEFGHDDDGDLIADLPETPVAIGSFFVVTYLPDGPTFDFLNWNDILPRVIERSENSQPTTEPPTIVDLFDLRAQPSEGQDTLLVGQFETVDALGGNDRIFAVEGNATIEFGAGSGNDLLVGQRGAGDQNNIVRLTGIALTQELQFLRSEDGKDLAVRIVATGETLTIRDEFVRDAAGAMQPTVASFQLADGTMISWQQALSLATQASTDGNSEVTTGNQGGTLDGGAGQDLLRGGTGDDVYRFGLGYDEDVARDAGGNDTLLIGAGIARTDLYFSRAGTGGGDLLVEVAGNDRLAITIAGQFSTPTAEIETFVFADGSSMSAREVERFILGTVSTGGDDVIRGFRGADQISAKTGNDVIAGEGGDDQIDGGAGRDVATYRGARSEYDVTVVDGVTIVRDLIEGRDGTDRLRNIEELRFESGNGSEVDLTPENRAPTAPALAFEIVEDSDLVIARADLLLGASDADGDILKLSGLANATGGNAWIDVDGNVRFRPAAGATGEAHFDYVVSDGNGGTATARISVTIQPVDDAPLANAVIPAIRVDEDRLVLAELPSNLFVDPEGGAIAVTVGLAGGGPLPGWLTFANGVLGGQPPTDFNGTIALEARGSDGHATTAIAFDLVVRPVNDAPRAAGSLPDIVVAPTSIVSLALAQAFFDPDGDALQVTIATADGAPLPAWLSFDGTTLSGTAPEGFIGRLDLVARASDGHAVLLRDFTIVAVDNLPPAVAQPLANVETDEDAPIDFTVPPGTFTDAEGDALTLSASLADGAPLPGWLSFAQGRFQGTPPADAHGAVAITVRASDASGSAQSSFVLVIRPVNDAPVVAAPLANIVVAEDAAIDFAVPAAPFSTATATR
jgi:Ca2+-binding RTX toxin-like protein